MKKLRLMALLVTLPLSMSFALAEDAHHPDKAMKAGVAMSDKDQQMNMSKMQESMLKMHELMHKIMETSDIKEREALMSEHSKMMQEKMRMMHGMKSKKMMEHGKMDGGMKGQ